MAFILPSLRSVQITIYSFGVKFRARRDGRSGGQWRIKERGVLKNKAVLCVGAQRGVAK